MENDNFDFSFDMRGIDRQALLEEAAERLNALGGYLGASESTTTAATPGGTMAMELNSDTIEFAGFPVVYRITDKDFLMRNLNVPTSFKQLTLDYKFYWLYFPIALFPKLGWGFNQLEMIVKFNPAEPIQHLRPKAYQILPDKKFQTKLNLQGHVEVRLDENFEFSAATQTLQANYGPVQGKVGASVDAKVAAGLGTVLGPFEYSMKKAQIDHTPVGMEMVRWDLNGAEFFQDDSPPLIVIFQVPQETMEVKIVAAMQAYRYFNLANATFQQAIKELPRKFREFFTSGMPVYKDASWDITPRL